MAQLTRAGIRAELQARGFDAYGSTQLDKYIDWAVNHVGRTARWLWEEQTTAVTLDPGEYRVTQADLGATVLASVERVFVTTTNYERQLEPMDSRTFFRDWFALDLSVSSRRGEPQYYSMRASDIYIVPPPIATRVVNVIWSGVEVLGIDTDMPNLPEEFEEAIVLAAGMRCHTRAREYEDAQVLRAQLDEAINDLLVRETFLFGESPDRVVPDDRWL